MMYNSNFFIFSYLFSYKIFYNNMYKRIQNSFYNCLIYNDFW